MAIVLDPEILQDDLAVSLAQAVATANKRASELGVDVPQSIITITQMANGEASWRINYGPKDYIERRGSDLTIEVDMDGASVKQVLKGQ